MLKLSFKESSKNVQVFNDRATVVAWTCSMEMPDWWAKIPIEIYEWADNHPSVFLSEGYGNSGGLRILLSAQGKSVCAEEDEFNAELGEWIAESRAKIKLYKFIHTLCEKLMKYYYDIMYGNAEFDIVRESHSEAPKDCLYLTCKKYQALWIKESHHLGKLLEGV